MSPARCGPRGGGPAGTVKSAAVRDRPSVQATAEPVTDVVGVMSWLTRGGRRGSPVARGIRKEAGLTAERRAVLA
ncbi:hypothetical protein GCM10020295_01380 [Streptomyces cinereospinus]